MSSVRQHVPAATARRIFGREPAVQAHGPVCASMAHGLLADLLDDRHDHSDDMIAAIKQRGDGDVAPRPKQGDSNLAPQRVERRGGRGWIRDRYRRLSDNMGAKHQGRRAAPRRSACHGDPAHCGTGDEGPRLHRTDAGVRARRSLESLPLAIQRDRLRRRQFRLHALPDRPRRAADDSGGQGQALGQDPSAVHARGIRRRAQGAATGHHADDDSLRHRT